MSHAVLDVAEFRDGAAIRQAARATRTRLWSLPRAVPASPKFVDFRPGRFDAAVPAPAAASERPAVAPTPPLSPPPWRAIIDSPDAPILSGLPSIRDIVAEVALFYGVSVLEIASPVRLARVVRPRQIAVYLARELSGRSLTFIGRVIGWKDHTAVLHAVHKIETLVAADPQVADEVAFLRDTMIRRFPALAGALPIANGRGTCAAVESEI